LRPPGTAKRREFVMAKEPEPKPTPEPEPEPELTPEPKPEPKPEPTELEKKRDAILKGEPEPGPEPKPKPDEEIEEVDWDKLMEENPELAKLGVKSVKDLAERYSGGLEQWRLDRDFMKQLEESGYDTKAKRKEILAKLQAKEDIKPPVKPEAPESFKNTRSKKLSSLIPQQRIDPTTEEARPLTEEEKAQEIKKMDDFAEMVYPSETEEVVKNTNAMAFDNEDDIQWLLFQLAPILEKFKDELIPNSVRADIQRHSELFPKTYQEIILEAKKKGQNFYNAVYHHFVTTTKSDQIEAERKKRWEEERVKEEEKKKTALDLEKKKKKGEPLETPKEFGKKSLMDKRKAILESKD